MQADLCNDAGFLSRDGPVELGDHALRPVVRLDFIGHRQCAQPRRGAPVATDDAADQPLVAVAARAFADAVSLAGGIEQGEVTGPAGGEETLFDGAAHGFRMARLGKAGGGHGPSVFDKYGRSVCADNFHGVPG